MKAARGQVALYLLLALVAIMVLAIANVDTFIAVRAKNHAMNAADAAALAAAHRQAELLNEIGALNLRHAEAEAVGDWEKCREIVRSQRILAFLGPLDCLRAANDAAKANGAMPNDEMSSTISRHVADIHSKYIQNPDLYPPPWDGAWEAYASALAAIASSGVCVGCDNVEYLDLNIKTGFPLTDKSFYFAVAGESWCKFVISGYKWLRLLDCDSRNMPRPSPRETICVVNNSEFCSLHLYVAPLILEESKTMELRTLLSMNGASFPPGSEVGFLDTRPPDDPSRLYFFYDCHNSEKDHKSWWWSDWREIQKQPTPYVGRIKPEFNVFGCPVRFRVISNIQRLLSGTTGQTEAKASAKPFGTINTLNGVASVIAQDAFDLVLPAYDAVRLVQYDAASPDIDRGRGTLTSTADAKWLAHVRDHVPRYCAEGISSLPTGCNYCSCLIKWEDPVYRAKAAAWIARNAETCQRGSGGSGPTGGVSYAY